MLYICSFQCVFISLWQRFVWSFTVFSPCYMPPPLQTTYRVDLFNSPLHCLSPRSNYKMLFCAAETMYEIYWSRVPPFDTQDMANRSCAISHLLRLPCKADLSCLQAIFKLWAPETYGAIGNFIINALHLSDLIQVCRRSRPKHAVYFHAATANKGTDDKPDHQHLSRDDAWWRITFELLWGAATRL